MEEESTIMLTISDLIQRGQPLTAASSLVPSRKMSTLERHKNSDQNHRHKHSFPFCQNPKPQTLKPLNHPTLLVGTLALPCFANLNSPIKCSCFQFSDDSATICCDILDFDPKMIGRKIRILAWNFIPLKCGNGSGKDGFLEIISCGFFQACSGRVCSLSNFGSFCLTSNACDLNNSSKIGCFIFGVIESISPVFVVPCVSGESGSRNISGFLVSILVCQCKFCISNLLVSELNDLSENVKDHCFIKSVMVYFCGLTSSWHPVILRLIGRILLLTGLKKKLVFIRKEESQLMYVTTDEVSLHIPKLFNKQNSIRDIDIRGKGECGSYTGVITGVYMQGMVVELDQNVMLLVTDQYLTVPHCLRIGAIVALKNVHFVDPKFSWGKMLILGACCRTSMYVESYSPWETGCLLKSHSQSRLQKFINSLSFAARLWALLVVSCFRKKFAGILSEKEILGSKHKEGLAQKYASSHLPPSAFQFRHGVLVEFCKHDLCSGVKELHYGHLRLVLPIANLISYCEASWKKVLDDWEKCSDFVGGINQKIHISCGGRSYAQSIRRVLRTEEIGALVLGTLKISLSSGRLQLVDATGSVDVIFDLPATWEFDRILEAKDFTVVVEGMPQKLVDLDSTIDQPLSCRSIFSNALLLRKMKTSLYLYHDPSDGDSRTRSLYFDWKGNSQELDNGKFHLLILTHKFPIQQKFQGDQAKRSNMFAQAIVLPWDLLVAGKNVDSVGVSLDRLRDSLEDLTRSEKRLTDKTCKVDQASIEASDYGLNDGGNGLSGHFSDSYGSYSNSNTESTSSPSYHPLELPCLIASKGVNCHHRGVLCCTKEHAKIISGCIAPRRKILMEFCPDSFCMYEVLKIGRCYLVKHQEKDMICSAKEMNQVSRSKVFLSSGTHLWSLTFSSIEGLQRSNISDAFLTSNSTDSGICSDINVYVPASALNSLENVIKILDGGPIEPTGSFMEESDILDRGGAILNASLQSLGPSCSNYPLPEGNLISLHGLVVAFHDCDGDALPVQPRPIPGEAYLPIFLQGNGGVCVHVLVDHQMVRIFCDPIKQTFPIGLGRDVYATFHRILVLSEPKRYMMTPVSFITIDHTSMKNRHCSDEFYLSSGTVGLLSVASPITVLTALMSDVLQSSELKPMQFRCRVVAVYILVVEKARTTAFQSSVFGIPFAGFVLDDGSSSCCCWADSERAASLLGLDSQEDLLEASAETFGRSKAAIYHLNQVVEQHGRVVVKNYGSIFDSACQDLAFSMDSDKPISSSDEDLLRSLITNASFSTSWTIVGGLMDAEATSLLEQRLTELDMAVPPLLNVWASSVSHTDMLAEARSIIQELV